MIKCCLLILLIPAITLLCCCSRAPDDPDIALEKQLIGTWKIQYNDSNVAGELISQYMPDYKASWHSTLALPEQPPEQHTAHGVWKVEDGYLYFKFEESSITDFPSGFSSADMIVNVNEQELTCIDSTSGEQYVKVRVQ